MKILKHSLHRRASVVGIIAALLLITAFATTTVALGHGAPAENAKNVIIMIGDGAGFNQYLLADYYENGKAGVQPYEKFPVKFGVTTYPEGGVYDPALAWKNFAYPTANKVTESDMAATAMATGFKTSAGVGWAQGASQQSILEVAEALGKSTGVVTSKYFNDATPAGFVAHNASRSKYFDIAHQMIGSQVDVILASGNPYYDNAGKYVASPWGTPAVPTTPGGAFGPFISEADWSALVAGTAGGDDPWTLIQARADFQKLAKGKTPDRVFGLAQAGRATQAYRAGDMLANPYVVPFSQNVPTLVEMTKAALNVLDNDPDGFVAMIEGGAIDDSCHYLNPGRIIEELGDFNNSIDVVLDWIKRNGGWEKNLLIVTADHETGYIWGPGAGWGSVHPALPDVATLADPNMWRPIINNGKGDLPGFTGGYVDFHNIFWHTNSLVPLWANGAGLGAFDTLTKNSDPVRGNYIDNTDIFTVMKEAITP